MSLSQTKTVPVARAVFLYVLMLLPPFTASGEVIWTVTVNEPASGKLDVTLRIPLESAGNRSHLDFAFPDAHGSSGHVSGFQAWSESKSLEMTEREIQRGQGYRVPIAGSSGETIVVAYTVDAQFYPPGSDGDSRADARAILETESGVLRTRTVFPMGPHTSLAAGLRFELPDGWTAVTPWDQESGLFNLPPNALRDTEYLGIGPFNLSEIRVGPTTYRIASMGAGSELVDKLPALVETERRIAGSDPREANLIHSIILVPRGFIQGGSAGRRSVVQSPDPVTLAHELFHWWNHAGIAAAEARWFSEGFTEFFGIQAALASGLISEAYAESCFSDFSGEVRYLERNGAVSLADASRRYGEPEGRRLVYAKGALLAYWMERELRKDGRELLDVLPIVFADSNRRHDNATLADAFDRAFDGAMNDAIDAYVESANALPDLALPDATGQSGRARFLPER